MRNPCIAGNWKMFKTVHDAVVYAKEFRGMVKDATDVDIVDRAGLPRRARGGRGGAELAGRGGGAGPVLGEGRGVHRRGERADGARGGRRVRHHRPLGAPAVLRRNRRIGQPENARCAGGGLVPIVCIGETLDERERGETMAVLDRQIKQGLDGLTGEQVAGLVIAYEPVWAIGTGRTATAQQAQDAHAHIRSRLRSWFGGHAADACRVLYGGSVKPDNIGELIAQPEVDGALVGGASLDPRSFAEIVKRTQRR